MRRRGSSGAPLGGRVETPPSVRRRVLPVRAQLEPRRLRPESASCNCRLQRLCRQMHGLELTCSGLAKRRGIRAIEKRLVWSLVLWEGFFQEMKNRGRKFHGISGNFHFQRKFPFPGWSGARPPTASTGSEAARPAPRRHVPVAVFRALGRTPRSPPPAGRRPWHRYVGVIIPIIRPRAGPTSCTCTCSNISES